MRCSSGITWSGVRPTRCQACGRPSGTASVRVACEVERMHQRVGQRGSHRPCWPRRRAAVGGRGDRCLHRPESASAARSAAPIAAWSVPSARRSASSTQVARAARSSTVAVFARKLRGQRQAADVVQQAGGERHLGRRAPARAQWPRRRSRCRWRGAEALEVEAFTADGAELRAQGCGAERCAQRAPAEHLDCATDAGHAAPARHRGRVG